MAGNRNERALRHETSQRFLQKEPVSLSSSSASLPSLSDWRHIPFLMVDSPKTRLMEDAVAARGHYHEKQWSADLKVVHPLPLEGAVSLKEGEDQLCLGIRDCIGREERKGAPAISLVVARNLTRISDRQADAILEGRERSVAGNGLEHPARIEHVKSQLKAVRATALQVSFWKDRPLTPEHVMAILATHVQTAAIQASRTLAASPALIVLRHQGSRPVTDKEWRAKGVPYATKRGISTVGVGKSVPTMLLGGEAPTPLDSLRLKERGNSGAINITQISCALLGISPLPDHLVNQGLRSDSETDTWKRGGPLPQELAAAIQERRNAIRELLTALTNRLLGPQQKA
jgi:hypothetical protein